MVLRLHFSMCLMSCETTSFDVVVEEAVAGWNLNVGVDVGRVNLGCEN